MAAKMQRVQQIDRAPVQRLYSSNAGRPACVYAAGQTVLRPALDLLPAVAAAAVVVSVAGSSHRLLLQESLI